jgi:hypothetical protein
MADVRNGSEEPLRRLLDHHGDMMQNHDAPIAFRNSQTIHFARWLIVEPPRGREADVPTRLVFSCNHDGVPEDAQLREVIALAGGVLDDIYAHCEGYPEARSLTDQARLQYLQKHSIKVNGIYIGALDRTLRQIRDEDELRTQIQRFLGTRDFAGMDRANVMEAVRQHVFNEPSLSWARQPAPPREKTLLRMILLALVLLPLLPLLVVWLLILRLRYERVEQPLNLMPSGLDPRLTKALEQREDIYVQNQFSQLMEIKAGRFRLLTLRGVLWLSNFLARNFYKFKNGEINGIPSIHFYSWIVIDEGKRLLFLSNFDGTWMSYLGDFIDKAAFGLNGVLSNCAGFPRTSFLFFKGVTDVERYKAWARNANIETQCWYTAYPTLNVKNVNTNSRIRRGLLENMDETATAEWLRCL